METMEQKHFVLLLGNILGNLPTSQTVLIKEKLHFILQSRKTHLNYILFEHILVV